MKRQILVIENNNALLQVYHEWLSLIGYQVQLAETPEMAERKLETSRYHGVIFDIDAIGAKGIHFLREYWLQFKIDGTRVAVISRGDRYRYECESMGIPFYTRPSRMKELENIVVRLLYGDFRPKGTRPLPARFS